METILEIKHLSKKYANLLVLDDISLSIDKGDIYGILGLSGAGKSTLVRCINGLDTFQEGEIYFDHKLVTFDRFYRKNVSMIFQNFNLLEQRNVLKNVELPLELFKQKNRTEKAKKMLELVGLSDKLFAYPSQLSGGQKQRVAIARALMNAPKILLCDEATSSLDPENTAVIIELLKKLNKDLGLTIIFISHQMNVIESICSKVAIIDQAKIVENGSLYDVFLNPKNEISKKLIYAGHLNTRLDEDKFIKLIFDGDIDSPLISSIVQDCAIVVSIVYADSKIINDKVYGQMIIKLPYYEKDIIKLEKYLTFHNVKYMEVEKDELC